MTTIQFSEEELAVLHEILENNLVTLGVEVHRTDNTDFKQRLTQRYKILERVISKMMKPDFAIT